MSICCVPFPENDIFFVLLTFVWCFCFYGVDITSVSVIYHSFLSNPNPTLFNCCDLLSPQTRTLISYKFIFVIVSLPLSLSVMLTLFLVGDFSQARMVLLSYHTKSRRDTLHH